MRKKPKELRELEKKIKPQGFTMEPSNGSHWLVKKDGRRVATLAGTSSDIRSMNNALSELRKAGYKDR